MTRSKRKKIPPWKIALGSSAILSGIFMTLSIGMIPSWFLYGRPSSLAFLLKIAVVGFIILATAIVTLADQPITEAKDLLPKFVFFISIMNVSRISGSIIHKSFNATNAEMSILLASIAMLYVVFKIERQTWRRRKPENG